MHSTMLLTATLSVLSSISSAQSTTGTRGDALIVTNNPLAAQYIATFPDTPNSPVRGQVHAETVLNGTGIRFAVAISGLPDNVGAFPYHIHDMPVPADGNCSGTLAHLDPFIRGEKPPCDASAPQTCQVGDLSGKYGPAASASFSATYIDLYSSLLPGIGAFFGNRSLVIHYANLTRIACANFVLITAGTPNNVTNNLTTTTLPGAGGGVVTATTVITTSVSGTHSASMSFVSMSITMGSETTGLASETAIVRTSVAMVTTSAMGNGADYMGVPVRFSFILSFIAALF